MRGLFKRTLAVLAALLVTPGLSSVLVTAQTSGGSGNGFRISPVRSELTIEKGKSSSLPITIENPTELPTVAKPVVNNFVASDKEDGEARLILEEVGPSPKNNFKNLVPKIEDVQLGPREKKDIQVTISVPEDAGAGGYYGAIRFAPAVTNTAGNVGLTASVGTIVLVTVPGNLTERLELVEVSAAQSGNAKSFFTGGDVSSIVRLKNTGDIHVKPFGKVQVKNMFGKVVQEYELNKTEPRANILPESVRKFDDALAKPSGGWLGRYTISANIGYSQGGGDLISTQAAFWYIPVWALIILLLVLAAIAGGVYWLLKKRDVKLHRKSKSSRN